MGLINFLFCFEFLLANSPSSALVPSSFYSSFVISMSPFYFAITNAFFALWPYVSIISACTFYLPLNLIFNLSTSIGVTSLSSLVPATTMASEEEKPACCCPMVSNAAPPTPEGKDVPSCYCFMFYDSFPPPTDAVVSGVAPTFNMHFLRCLSKLHS